MPTETSTHAPTQRRLHRSTFVVVGLVLLLGVIMNCGGDYDQEYMVVSYGWPWSYELHKPTEQFASSWLMRDSKILLWSPWRVDLLEEFYALSVVANLLAVGVLVMTAAWLWEWRRRKVKRWYQFTIADWLMVTVGMALCYAGYEQLYKEKKLMSELEYEIQNLNPLTSIQLAGQGRPNRTDVPWDCFWETFRVPEESRPYVLLDFCLLLHFNSEDVSDKDLEEFNRSEVIPHNVFDSIQSFQYLERCAISIDNEKHRLDIPATIFLGVANCKNLKHFYLQATGDWFTDAHVFPLSKIRSLQSLSLCGNPNFHGDRLSHLNRLTYLSIENTGLNDNGLAELAQLEQVQELKLAWNENITSGGWSALERLKSVKRLHIESHSFGRMGLQALGNLTELEELNLTTWKAVSEDSWKALSKLKKLRKLHIDCPMFDDQALVALENLPELKALELDNTSLTRYAFASFSRMKGLEELRLHNRSTKVGLNWQREGGIPFGTMGLDAGDEEEFRAVVESR